MTTWTPQGHPTTPWGDRGFGNILDCPDFEVLDRIADCWTLFEKAEIVKGLAFSGSHALQLNTVVNTFGGPPDVVDDLVETVQVGVVRGEDYRIRLRAYPDFALDGLYDQTLKLALQNGPGDPLPIVVLTMPNGGSGWEVHTHDFTAAGDWVKIRIASATSGGGAGIFGGWWLVDLVELLGTKLWTEPAAAATSWTPRAPGAPWV